MFRKRQIEKAFVFDEFGLAKVMFDFNEDQLVVDEVLLSGFLSAIDGFSQNIFQNQSTHFMIDTGCQKISLFKSAGLIIAIISNESLMAYKDSILKLLQYFAQKYDIQSNSRQDTAVYEDFKIKLIRILFEIPISVDWVPIRIQNDEKSSDWDHLCHKFPFLKMVDGKTEIQQLSGVNAENKEEVLEVFNYCFYEELVKFDKIIEPRDYIIGTEKLFALLQGKSDEYKILKNRFKEYPLVKLFTQLKEYKAVYSLQKMYEDNVIQVLIDLFADGYIQLIPDNPRRLLVLIDLVEEFLQILQKIVKPKKFAMDIHFLLDRLDFPELSSRVKLGDKKVWINKQNLEEVFENHNSDEHNSADFQKRIQPWLEFEKDLIEFYYPKYQDKLNAIIHEKLIDQYLQLIHPQDLEVLNPFLTTIENACLDD